MRVPTTDAQRVALRGLPGPQPVNIQPDRQMVQAVAEAGASLQRLGASADKLVAREEDAAEKARKEAQALAEAQAAVAFDKAAQRRLQGDSSTKGRIDDAFDDYDTSKGFLRTEGTDADKAASAALERIEKDASEAVALVQDPQSKERVRLRVAQSMLGYRHQIEQHATRQHSAARKDTIDARTHHVMGGIENGTITSDNFAEEMDALKSDYYRLLPKEAADAAWQVSRENAALAYITRQVRDGNIDEARGALEALRPGLGTKYAEAETLVKRGRLEHRAVEESREAQSVAEPIVRGSLDGWTLIDKAKAEKALAEKVRELREKAATETLEPGETKTKSGRLADLVEARANAMIKDQVDREKVMTSEAKKEAYRTANAHGTMDPKLRVYLQTHDPEFLWDFEHQQAARRKALNAPTPGQRTRDEQNTDTARNMFTAALYDDPTLDPYKFATEWGRKHPALTENGVSELVKTAAAAKNKDETKDDKGEKHRERTFMLKVTQAGGFQVRNGDKMDAKKGQELLFFKGEALKRYRAKQAEVGDKALTPEEENELLIGLVEVKTAIVNKTFLGITYESTQKYPGWKPPPNMVDNKGEAPVDPTKTPAYLKDPAAPTWSNPPVPVGGVMPEGTDISPETPPIPKRVKVRHKKTGSWNTYTPEEAAKYRGRPEFEVE